MFKDFQSHLKKKAGLTQEELGPLAGLLKSKTVDKEQILLSEGEVCEDAFNTYKYSTRKLTIKK